MVKVLPIHSGVVLVCKGRGGKKKTLGPEQFFQVQPSKTELRARYSTMPGLESSFWGGIRLQRRPGEEKNFQVPKVCFWFGCPKQGRQARQAKTSQHKPRVASEVRQPSVSLAGVWLVSGWSCRHQPWWPSIRVRITRIAPCLSLAWKFRGSYSFFWEIAADNQCLVYWYQLYKGEQEPVARIPGYPSVLISMTWQKGLNPAIQPLKFLLQ